MKKLLSFLFVLALLAGACGSDDSNATSDANGDGATASDGATGSDADSTPTSDSGGSNGSSFCEMARTLDETDILSDAAMPSKDMFEAAAAAMQQAIAAAPSEIKGDLEVLGDAFVEFQTLLEKYDYNFLDPAFQTAMEALDTSEMEAAGARVDAYLESECGIKASDASGMGTDTDGTAPGIGDLAGLDPSMLEGLADNPAALLALLSGFGIDAETAQCLVTELPTMGIDPDNVDTSVLTEPICGSTLIEIFSNLGTSG
jgi:hypothetical protein